MKTLKFIIIGILAVVNAWGQDVKEDTSIKAPPLPCVTPTTQANNFSASASGSSSIDLTWTRGDGDYVIILAHETAAVDADPVNGTTYTANSNFGSGSQIGTGNYVVYIGSSTSTTVTGLSASTTYYFAIYEFNDADKCYLTPGATTNATTAAGPPSISSVSPDNFFTDKGKQLTITGSNLSGATVTLGGVTGTIVSNTATQIVVNFPPEYYSNNTLTVSTGVSPDATHTVTVNKRNVIPVGGGTDYHSSIQSALDGLEAWYKTTSFDAGQLPGQKIIDVYSGTYTEDVTPSNSLEPTATDNLVIQNHSGETPIIDASGLTNAFTIGLQYTEVKGFTAHSSKDALVSVTADNIYIHLNQLYGSTAGSGILINGGNSAKLENNLIYNNYNFGIRVSNANNTIVKNNTVANDGHTSKAPPLPSIYEPAELYVESGTGTSVQNNIFYAKSGTVCLTLKTESGVTVSSDYNTYFKNGNNYLVNYNVNYYADLAAWSGNGAGANDLESDPDFVNAGTDWHIHSTAGSYAGGSWPPDVQAGGTWTNDASISPALDAGNPSDAYANEPLSGNRINQGAYGNTTQASKSPCTPPTTQANNFSASASGSSSIDLTWTRGDGDYVIILAHESSAVDADPSSGTSYTANSNFGSGSQIGTGNYVVYIGNSTSTTVTSLNPSTTYYFAIYEFYDADKCYLTPGATANATTPAQPPSITSVSPDNFFTDKGKQLTIDGSALSSATVTLGGVTGTIVSNTATQIVVNFPPEYYSNDTLTVSTGVSPDATYTVTVNKRNIIPVGGGTDYHTTIQSALDGLAAWYKTTSFDAGQLPGQKIIDVYSGTYTEDVSPSTSLVPTSTDNLVIQNHLGEAPVVDATGLTNAFTIGLQYTEVKGFTAHSSKDALVSVTADNSYIHLNQLYGSTAGSGILVDGGNSATLKNNLVYNNYNFGIRIRNSNNSVVKNNTLANDGHTAKAPPLPSIYDPAELYVESGTGTSVQNNIFYAKTGTNYFTLKTETGVTVSSDYNTYYKNGNNYLVYYNGSVYADLAAWSGNGAGANDLESDPDFVNAGTDWHIHSQFGSYAGGSWPPDVQSGGTWTTDATTSPALDAGNPSDAYSNEPQSGNRINQGAYGNTVQASKSAVNDIYWTGNVSIDWQDPNNWSPTQVPSSGDNAIIPDGRPNYPVIDDGTTTAECFNLNIDANASVTIATNGQMTVYGTVTNNRGVDGLIIQSDNTGDGSLIMNTPNIDATVQRFLPTGGSAEWHFISPAITNATTSGYSVLYAYDETQDDWWTGPTYYYNGTSGWTAPPATMSSANGYINYQNQTTLTWQGPLNANSSYTVSASYTVHSGNAANGNPYTNYDGWLLTGNPYPCALDWELLDKSNDIGNTVYYYDDNIDNYAYYQDGGTSVNGGSRYIPMGQGFFVKTDDQTDGGAITIPANARVHNDQDFWKKSFDNELKLKITYKNYFDETLIRIDSTATLDYDSYKDAYKQFSWKAEVPQIFTYNPANNVMTAINSLPLTGYRTVVPLGYKYFEDTSATIQLEQNKLKNVFVIAHNVLDKSYTFLKDSGDFIKINAKAGLHLGKMELILEKNVAPQTTQTLQNVEVTAGSDFTVALPMDLFTDKNEFDKLAYNVTCDGNDLPDWLSFNPKTFVFSGTAPQFGEYHIRITATDLFGKTADAEFLLTVKTPTGMAASDNSVTIYPVPADNTISVGNVAQFDNIAIKSVTGQFLMNRKIENDKANIDVSQLAEGVYILQLTKQDGTELNRQIVVQH